ncbi:hypothetical protein OPAG_06928 [Rhodococcus opacus PD630]|uniref:MCE family protein n=1 Tax=Rhodococcus opacus TaxID=37919 RepID=UPI00029CD337|nr:MCE family protein [Rhodococcus opacus]AHK36150.1 hypothetical protein Pd630_LPD16191 [Rhodococcus opacus PD630]EHI43640.1 hypothetical protein OPAG_06928 [Rhodococcus opacus PD630]UDH01234.1 MCE family protein [Rhodococcus opacus PD630]
MRRFENRNTARTGVIGIAMSAALVLTAMNFDSIPLISSGREVRAIFADAGGLKTGNSVEFAGVTVGKVRTIELRGTDVAVAMTIDDDLDLGDQPEAAIKTRSVLGGKGVVLTARGEGTLPGDATIPLERTRTAYNLTTELGDVTDAVEGIDTTQLSDSLHAASDVLDETSPELHTALDGVERLSRSVGSRDALVQELFANGSSVSGVLAERSKQINTLLIDGNALLTEIDARRSAIATLIDNVAAVAQQVSGLVADNREQLAPTLDRLNRVLDLLRNNQQSLGAALPGANQYVSTLGEAVASGPFFNAYVANLVPGQYVQPFIDAGLGDGRVPPPHTVNKDGGVR